MDTKNHQHKRVTQIGQLFLANKTAEVTATRVAETSPLEDHAVSRKRPSAHIDETADQDVRPPRLIKKPHFFGIKEGPPTEHYDISPMKMEIGGIVALAAKKVSPSICVHIREFPHHEAEKVLHWCKRLRHSNLVKATESYRTEQTCYVVYEEMSADMERLVSSIMYPNENELGLIFRQILDALCYLEKSGFHCSTLTASMILLNLAGEVKIKSLTKWIQVNHDYVANGAEDDSRTDVMRDLDSIMLQLMYKTSHGKNAEIDAERWANASTVVSFRAAIKSAKSFTELLQHPLVHSRQNDGALSILVRLAMVSVPQQYRFQRNN